MTAIAASSASSMPLTRPEDVLIPLIIVPSFNPVEKPRTADVKRFAEIVPAELLPHLVAHRGFHFTNDSVERPLENTFEAFTSAWENGIESCECDVTHSSDGVVVMAHDSTFERLAKTTDALHCASVEGLRFNELQEIRLKDDSGILTLQTMLMWLKRNEYRLPKAKLVVEIKSTADIEVITRAILTLIQDMEITAAKVPIIMSFRTDTVLRMKQILVESRTPCPPKVMLLTQVKLLNDGRAIQMPKDKPLSFNLEDQSCLEIIPSKLLQRKLDGIYMQFEDKMLDGATATQNLKSLCERTTVGVWFSKLQCDEEKTCLALKKLGVSFINTDIPTNDGFFSV